MFFYYSVAALERLRKTNTNVQNTMKSNNAVAAGVVRIELEEKSEDSVCLLHFRMMRMNHWH